MASNTPESFVSYTTLSPVRSSEGTHTSCLVLIEADERGALTLYDANTPNSGTEALSIETALSIFLSLVRRVQHDAEVRGRHTFG